MRETTKQVLILNNFSIPEIQQAIIILKNPNPTDETKIVIEAERVIESYLKKRRGKSVRTEGLLLLAVIVIGLAVTALAVYGAAALFGRIW